MVGLPAYTGTAIRKRRSKPRKACSDVVPVAGFEPAWISPPHFEFLG